VCQSTNRRLGSLRKKWANNEISRVEEKHPIDQRSNEIPTHMAANPVRQILRKFGEPPKIRRLLSAGRAADDAKLFVTSLILWRFSINTRQRPRWLASCEVSQRRSPFIALQTAAGRRQSRPLLMQIVAFLQPRENRHEVCKHLIVVGRGARRPEHDGGRRRRLRSRCVQGRLRKRRPRRRRSSCGSSCCCRATGCRCRPQRGCCTP
jgi:hypothetical protein